MEKSDKEEIGEAGSDQDMVSFIHYSKGFRYYFAYGEASEGF